MNYQGIEIIDIIQILLLLGLLYAVLKHSPGKISGSTKKGDKKLVLDTCALIDGRILEISNAGFTASQLVIPQFIIHELQLLADGQDAHKRERARFGLDMVQALQNSNHCDVVVLKDTVEPKMPTDDKLVVVAKELTADLCTTDYNLNKVATIAGVRVLNVNELSNAVRPVALPGEKKRIKIVQRGSNKDQGVGYLEDGSMVVVEGASRAIGKIVDVEVSRFIQTDAGKMLFAQIANPKSQNRKR
jgi:uncharacterized protein YacL